MLTKKQIIIKDKKINDLRSELETATRDNNFNTLAHFVSTYKCLDDAYTVNHQSKNDIYINDIITDDIIKKILIYDNTKINEKFLSLSYVKERIKRGHKFITNNLSLDTIRLILINNCNDDNLCWKVINDLSLDKLVSVMSDKKCLSIIKTIFKDIDSYCTLLQDIVRKEITIDKLILVETLFQYLEPFEDKCFSLVGLFSFICYHISLGSLWSHKTAYYVVMIALLNNHNKKYGIKETKDFIVESLLVDTIRNYWTKEDYEFRFLSYITNTNIPNYQHRYCYRGMYHLIEIITIYNEYNKYTMYDYVDEIVKYMYEYVDEIAKYRNKQITNNIDLVLGEAIVLTHNNVVSWLSFITQQCKIQIHVSNSIYFGILKYWKYKHHHPFVKLIMHSIEYGYYHPELVKLLEADDIRKVKELQKTQYQKLCPFLDKYLTEKGIIKIISRYLGISEEDMF